MFSQATIEFLRTAFLNKMYTTEEIKFYLDAGRITQEQHDYIIGS